MPYQEHHPGAALAPFVECFWTNATEAAKLHLVPPDGCIDLVCSWEAGLRAVGAMTRIGRFPYPKDSSIVGVRFRPGAAGAFLGIAPGELTDQIVPIEEVWGDGEGRQFRDRLEDSEGPDAQMRVLRSALERRRPDPVPLQKAIDSLAASPEVSDLDWVARQANLSPRQFRRRCREEVGLSPKQLCRVLRFQRALAGMHAGRAWVDLACECGYFDQAHLIRDFREFTGSPPAEFREMTVLSNP